MPVTPIRLSQEVAAAERIADMYMCNSMVKFVHLWTFMLNDYLTFVRGGHVAAVLGISGIVEGYSLWVAVRAVSQGAQAAGLTFWEFVKRGMDPTSIAVMMEDAAAVTGLGIAGAPSAWSVKLKGIAGETAVSVHHPCVQVRHLFIKPLPSIDSTNNLSKVEPVCRLYRSFDQVRSCFQARTSRLYRTSEDAASGNGAHMFLHLTAMCFAGVSTYLAHSTGLSFYDAIGTISVGALLALTALFLVQKNRQLLLGRNCNFLHCPLNANVYSL